MALISILRRPMVTVGAYAARRMERRGRRAGRAAAGGRAREARGDGGERRAQRGADNENEVAATRRLYDTRTRR